jgi:thymidylate synthase
MFKIDNSNGSDLDPMFVDLFTHKVSDKIFEATNVNMVANNLGSNNLEEQQYLDLIKDILDNGTWEEGRNGRTKSVFGRSMRFSLADGKIPILTTKKTAWKTCLKELLWFIRGETDARLLQDQNVHIWDGNTTREFLDSRGLQSTKEGLIGAGYGFQWRHFNAPYNNQTGKPLIPSLGIDQLQQIIDELKDPAKRNSRRLVMTAWNPSQLDKMALPPCHIMCQFNVHDGNKLSCCMMQRSNDEACGTSFNIASYSFLTHLLAKHCGLEAYEFVYFKGNCHIYEEHIEGMKTQIERKPFPFPTVSIKEVRKNINDYQVDDFVVTGYHHHEPIKFQMVV